MSRRPENLLHVNRARLEARRMHWPNVIDDPDGDRERELRRSRRRTAFWRTAWLFTAGVLFTLLLLWLVGAL